MKSGIGSLGLYCDGLRPSITPPWDGALEALVAAAAAEDVVDMLSALKETDKENAFAMKIKIPPVIARPSNSARNRSRRDKKI